MADRPHYPIPQQTPFSSDPSLLGKRGHRVLSWSFEPSVAGEGGQWFIYLVDLKSVRELPSIRNHLRPPQNLPEDFINGCRRKPQKPQRSATLRAPGGSM